MGGAQNVFGVAAGDGQFWSSSGAVGGAECSTGAGEAGAGEGVAAATSPLGERGIGWWPAGYVVRPARVSVAGRSRACWEVPADAGLEDGADPDVPCPRAGAKKNRALSLRTGECDPPLPSARRSVWTVVGPAARRFTRDAIGSADPERT